MEPIGCAEMPVTTNLSCVTSPKSDDLNVFNANINEQYRLTFLIIYLITPWSRVLLETLTGFQLVKKFPAFYGTRRFITAFTRAATYPYPVPARFTLCPHIQVPEDPP